MRNMPEPWLTQSRCIWLTMDEALTYGGAIFAAWSRAATDPGRTAADYAGWPVAHDVLRALGRPEEQPKEEEPF